MATIAPHTLTPGQTFRQGGGRLLHVFAGERTRTDRGGRVLTFQAAACGTSYQPENGDAPEVSGRKVCGKCEAAHITTPAAAPAKADKVVTRSTCGVDIEVGTTWRTIRDAVAAAGCKAPEACADDCAYWLDVTDGADED